jgi:hypothetical protein
LYAFGSFFASTDASIFAGLSKFASLNIDKTDTSTASTPRMGRPEEGGEERKGKR